MELTRFEKARLISARALQLALGAPLLVNIKQDLEPNEIAKIELSKKVLPLAVLREYPNGTIKRVELA